MGILEKIAIKFGARKLQASLSGKKAYMAGIGLIAMGVVLITEDNYEAGLTKIFEGFGVIGLRAGVAKAAI